MKERVLVKYQYQNDPHDKTFNCYFILKDSDKPLRVLDVIAEFPGLKLREYGDKGFHFRFHDKLGKVNCWVDIKNLAAAVPLNKNLVEMRVLVLPSQSDSLIFHHIEHDLQRREARLSKELQEEADSRRAIATPQPRPISRQEPPQKAPERKEKPSKVDLISGDTEADLMGFQAPVKSPSPISQSTPLPRNTDEDDIDILDGDHHTAPVHDKDDSASQENRLNEMFGPDFDFDPTATNRVLDVIYIKEKQEMMTKQNIEAIEERNRKNLELQDAKLEASQKIEPMIKSWSMASNGSKNNIRILLTSLTQILWEGADWEPISMADLVTDGNVKKQYMKAIMKVHPDQNSDVTDPYNMYLMDRVFNILNDSYTDFTKTKR